MPLMWPIEMPYALGDSQEIDYILVDTPPPAPPVVVAPIPTGYWEPPPGVPWGEGLVPGLFPDGGVIPPSTQGATWVPWTPAPTDGTPWVIPPSVPPSTDLPPVIIPPITLPGGDAGGSGGSGGSGGPSFGAGAAGTVLGVPVWLWAVGVLAVVGMQTRRGA